MIKVRCTAERKLFPPDKESELDFMLCAYRARDISELPEGAVSNRFVAKGNLLPYSPASEIILYGSQWEANNGEFTLTCIGYEEVIPNNAYGVSSFLNTLPGCVQGHVTRIINEAPDDNPLLALYDGGAIIQRAVKNDHFAKKLHHACELRIGKRDIFFYTLPFLTKGTSAQVAANLAAEAKDLSEVKRNPFRFCVSGTIPYKVALNIAKDNAVPKDCYEGVQAAITDVLMQAEGKSAGKAFDEQDVSGSTYIELDELLKRAGNILGIDKKASLLCSALDGLLQAGLFVCVHDKYIYRTCTAEAEYGIAGEIDRLLHCEISSRDYTLDIYGLENKKRTRLAPEQRRAVKTVLNNSVTLLIGGPGTGKTTIEQFIIETYRLYHKTPVLLVAPTGKAARRMSESTGEPASTVHKALGVSAGAEVITTNTILDAGLIIIDEASMLDAQITFALLKAIKQGTQVVFVGDTNQLPSVGSGNVLFELIRSEVVPVAALETVYRQKAGSAISANCAKIRRGSENLEYSDIFQFIEASTQEDAAEKVISAYKAELALGLGTEDVCLLSPYRRTTPTGVNQLNQRLQSMLMGKDRPSFSYGKKTLYLGDKVMLMANRDDVANGDVGYITALDVQKKVFDVDYGDGRVITYKKSDLRDFELAYGISIHKSQGAEFATCIIVLMDEHKAMLKRNLIYTAVSRAKKKVILVGTKSALETAIHTEDVSKRLSRLGDIIAELHANRLAAAG